MREGCNLLRVEAYVLLKSAKEIWDKIIQSYERHSQVKRAKLQTLRIQYGTLQMHSNESIASYFLRIDDLVNCMKNLGEEIKEVSLVEKVLRSLSAKFESNVSAIEEQPYLQNITMTQLHGILTAFEMRKGGSSDMREASFKASTKGKEKKEHNESGHISEEEDVINFVKKLQQGSGRFRGKLPFKCFSCGRVSHYVAKCPHKVKYEKGKEYVKGNRKQVVNRRSYYTHQDSNGLSNSDEDETGRDYRLLMAYDSNDFWDSLEEDSGGLSNSDDYRLLMAYENDDFWDSLEEKKFHEEISELKICLEEKNMIIDTLTYQRDEKEKQNEKLECEIVGPRKDFEKTKSLSLRFVNGSETLNEILKVQRSPLIKTSPGYIEEAS
eukprot:PITA_31312